MSSYNLLDKQISALKCFRSGLLLSANQLADRLCIVRTNAQLRIDELRDKGMLKKNNATQFSITPKGLTALNTYERQQAGEDEEVAAEEVKAVELEPQAAAVKAVEVEELEAEVVPTPEPEPEPVEVPALVQKEAAASTDKPAEPESYPHDALLAIGRLQDALTKPKPIQVKDLELKKDVLCRLAHILEQSITDVLVEICDDLDRAAGNEV